MKNLIVIGLLLSSAAMADRPSLGTDSFEEYKFRFVLSKETYDYEITSNSYRSAFEKAAQACFGHFKSGRHLSEDQGLDIIDTCANPAKL